MDMNKICATPMYKCAVCGEVYDSIAQRMHCEQSCIKKQEEEARKADEAKKIAEYEARAKEVRDAFKHAYMLRDKLEEDYSNLRFYKRNNMNDIIKILFYV
jgi:Mg2+ and Co2+ transporter CorA